MTQGGDNTYTYLGSIDVYANGQQCSQFKFGSKELKESDKSVVAFSCMLRHLKAGRIPENAEFWCEGRCGSCGRALTVPEGIKTGFGPECKRRQEKDKTYSGDFSWAA